MFCFITQYGQREPNTRPTIFQDRGKIPNDAPSALAVTTKLLEGIDNYLVEGKRILTGDSFLTTPKFLWPFWKGFRFCKLAIGARPDKERK
jgi:hypothetical protein